MRTTIILIIPVYETEHFQNFTRTHIFFSGDFLFYDFKR